MIRETARILWMIALCMAGGAWVGVAAAALGSALFSARYTGELLLDYAVLGAAGGYLSSAVLVPLLWRRPLATAYPLVFAVGLLVGAATSFGATDVALVAGLLATCAAAIIVAARLPIVFPERLPGLCPFCGYSTRGLRSPRCPECGRHLLRDGRRQCR